MEICTTSILECVVSKKWQFCHVSSSHCVCYVLAPSYFISLWSRDISVQNWLWLSPWLASNNKYLLSSMYNMQRKSCTSFMSCRRPVTWPLKKLSFLNQRPPWYSCTVRNVFMSSVTRFDYWSWMSPTSLLFIHKEQYYMGKRGLEMNADEWFGTHCQLPQITGDSRGKNMFFCSSCRAFIVKWPEIWDTYL